MPGMTSESHKERKIIPARKMTVKTKVRKTKEKCLNSVSMKIGDEAAARRPPGRRLTSSCSDRAEIDVEVDDGEQDDGRRSRRRTSDVLAEVLPGVRDFRGQVVRRAWRS